MSPLRAEAITAEGEAYISPFIGPIDYRATVRLDVSGLTSAEIDSGGYLKPGVPLDTAGLLVVTSGVVYGLVIEPTKVAAGNAAGDISGATDIDIALALVCTVNRAVAEDILGRAYTADEVSGLPATIILIE